MSAPLFVGLTHHTVHLLEQAGAEAALFERLQPSEVKGRNVILAPSAAKPEGVATAAAHRLRRMGALVVVVPAELLGGCSDVADFLETAEANGKRANLEMLAALTQEKARSSTQSSANEAQDESPTVQLLRGADIKPEAINWLWRGFLAQGKLHMIAGAPGAGKTTIALALAATLSTGGRWPDRTRAEPSNVLIWSGEDDAADTLLPRLIAMGGDPTRVYFVGDVLADGKKRPFDPARDMAALEREAARTGNVRLLIVDPVVTAVSGDSHKNSETRRGLQPVVDLAARLGAAALGVSHFSKGTAGRDPVERVTGSVAFGALPRVIFAAAKRPENDGGGRIFVRTKSNIGPDGGGFGYDLEQVELPAHPGVTASRVLWGAPLDGTASDLLASAEAVEEGGERSATDEAEAFLRAILAGGEQSARDVKQRAEAEGLTPKALRRARERLGVSVRRDGYGAGMKSLWTLPVGPQDTIRAQSCPFPDWGTKGTNEGEL